MKKFSVVLYKKGQHNEAILSMIANHNDGKADISLADISGYIKCRAAEVPILFSTSEALFNELAAGTVLNIIEGGNITLEISLS